MSEIRRVTVIGAGTMGHGIAQVAAAAGYDVTLNDVADEAIEAGLASIRANLDKGVAKGKVEASARDATLSRIQGHADLEQAASSADLAIEAVPEIPELKQKIFSTLDRACPAHTLLASNTSSISIGRIAEATDRPRQVLGMHFFNPVHHHGAAGAGARFRRHQPTTRWSRALDLGRRRWARSRSSCATRRASPPAAWVWVLGLEAIRMVEQEVASPEDIDKAMTLGYRHPMGPLRSDRSGRAGRAAGDRRPPAPRSSDSETFRPPDLHASDGLRGTAGQEVRPGLLRVVRMPDAG